jgi:hypothetical protein
MSARPEHSIISISHDLEQAQHRLACAAEHMNGKAARELILQATRTRRIRRMFIDGKVSDGIAQAFSEAANLIAAMAERGQR